MCVANCVLVICVFLRLCFSALYCPIWSYLVLSGAIWPYIPNKTYLLMRFPEIRPRISLYDLHTFHVCGEIYSGQKR